MFLELSIPLKNSFKIQTPPLLMFLLTRPSTQKNCCFHIHDENENTNFFQEVDTNLGGKKKKKTL